MAFSATDWRYRLSEWSGSSQGNRSWSGLGASTRNGQYYSYFYTYNYAIHYVYVGFGGTTNARNVEPYYASAYRVDYFQAYSYNPLCGYTQYFQNYSSYVYFNFYVGQGNYTGYATSKPSPYYFYSGYSYYYTEIYNSGGYSAVTSWSPSTFYNYSPYGGGPYSAGSNIFIGSGGSSGYPYQYIHG